MALRSEYLERVSRIATDNVSSAQQILKNTLDLLFDFASSSSGTADFAMELKSLSTSISRAQSQMSALSNVCKFVIAAYSKLKPVEIAPYLDNLRKKVGEAPFKAASQVGKFISRGKSYATISQSEFITKSFEQAAQDGKFATVYVMESRPLFEGRQTARALMRMGHRSVLVSDASIEIFINEIDSAFVGADSILSDGTLVNKIGSYPLAVCCAANKKNFYVVTSVLKYDPERTANDFVNKEESSHEIFANPEFSEWTPSVEVRNFYFDKVSMEFVTRIITEVGSVSPSIELEKLDSLMKELYNPSREVS